jgi:hypothetical protein
MKFDKFIEKAQEAKEGELTKAAATAAAAAG